MAQEVDIIKEISHILIEVIGVQTKSVSEQDSMEDLGVNDTEMEAFIYELEEALEVDLDYDDTLQDVFTSESPLINLIEHLEKDHDITKI